MGEEVVPSAQPIVFIKIDKILATLEQIELRLI